MGTTEAALALCACVLGYASSAAAEPCTAQTASGSPFAICFDVGNRVFLEGGTEGLGLGIRVRHIIGFDEEPDLSWKMEHRLLEASAGGLQDDFAGALYVGRYLRHARDGHVVLPLGTPRKFFVPFDIGAEASVARFHQRDPLSPVEIGVVRVAGLVDLSRSADFRRRLALGVVAHWDLQLQPEDLSVDENQVAPFSVLSVSAYWEGRNGLSIVELDISAGREWSSRVGWQNASSASLSLERILIAINDRPLSLLVEAHARGTPEPRSAEFTALVGARFSIFSAKR